MDEPHPSGEVPPTGPGPESLPATEATPAVRPPGGSDVFQRARGSELGPAPNAVLGGPLPTSSEADGFRNERPASHARLVGMHARSIRVPAVLFVLGALVYVATFV